MPQERRVTGRARRTPFEGAFQRAREVTELIRHQQSVDDELQPVVRPMPPGTDPWNRPMKEGVRSGKGPANRGVGYLPAGSTSADTAAALGSQYHTSPEMAREIGRIASRHGIPMETAFGLVDTESSFRQDQVSGVGAIGLAQVRPEYAGVEVGATAEQLRNPTDNLDAGFEYLRRQIKDTGSVERGLDAYNRGPAAAKRSPKRGYARKVMGGS